MTESVPTPEGDPLALAPYIENWLRADTDGEPNGWVGDVGRRLAASLSEDVIEPALEEGRFAIAHIDQWQRVLAEHKADVVRLTDEVTEAHTRNANLRSEHRRDRNALARLVLAATDSWSPDDADFAKQVDGAEAAIDRLRDLSTSMSAEGWAEMREQRDEARAALVAIGAQRDDAEEERTSMVRDLHAAQFDGATSLPDRPLDTVWEWLLDLVRKDRARLSGGSTPTDAAKRIERAAKYLLSLQQAGGVSPEELGQLWANVADSRRELWRGRARVLGGLLAGSGWGAAVATPEATTDEHLDVDQIPADRVEKLAQWLHGRNIGICEMDSDDVYTGLDSMRELAQQLLQHGPDGIRITAAGPVVPAPAEEA